MLPDPAVPYPPGTIWQWQDRRGAQRRGELSLYWEASGDPLSDNFSPDEEDGDAGSLWRRWVKGLFEVKGPHDRDGFDRDFGHGWVRIYWFVAGDEAGVFEEAPFALMPSDWGEDTNFLSSYTPPMRADTGERVNWCRLPVVDKRWRPGHADKGGFVQEALGWKPAALQPAIHLPSLSRAAGLWWPES